LKNKRGEKIVNGSLSSLFLPQSQIYMGRKIGDNYSANVGIPNKRMKSNPDGCGCGSKNKQVGEKNK
jgi:hypothetical protein